MPYFKHAERNEMKSKRERNIISKDQLERIFGLLSSTALSTAQGDWKLVEYNFEGPTGEDFRIAFFDYAQLRSESSGESGMMGNTWGRSNRVGLVGS
jgi:hypothetical protein